MIILNADDFGLNAGANRGIVELATARRLSATSALVTLDDWPQSARQLSEIRSRIAVGLHLNLTLGMASKPAKEAAHTTSDGTFLPLKSLIARALMRQLDRAALQAECHNQIALFQEATGALPDFIDGHEHVHALPVIRDGLISAIGSFQWPSPPLIRTPDNDRAQLFGARDVALKQTVVAWLARGFRAKLAKSQLPTNESFAGFSAFKIGADYAVELQRALAGGGTPHLVMCHPGHVDEALANRGDPIARRRAEEHSGMMALDDLPDLIWHPGRRADGAIDWRAVIADQEARRISHDVAAVKAQ